MAVDPRYIAKLISEDPNGPSDLAEMRVLASGTCVSISDFN